MARALAQDRVRLPPSPAPQLDLRPHPVPAFLMGIFPTQQRHLGSIHENDILPDIGGGSVQEGERSSTSRIGDGPTDHGDRVIRPQEQLRREV